MEKTMKKLIIFSYLFVILSTFLLSSCTSRIGDFTVISTRNSNIKNWKRSPNRIEGSSCKFWLLFIPLKWEFNIKDAVEDAIDKSNKENASSGLKSESLLDAKISIGTYTILLATWSCLYAEGMPADSWYKTEEREEQIKKE
jgi:hypothetical protein